MPNITGDRFIPFRSSSRFDLLHLPNNSRSTCNSRLFAALFGQNRDSHTTNIFRYRIEGRRHLTPSEFDDDQVPGSSVKAPRKIHASPYKILYLPELADDFSLNVLDWSSNNVLCVGLGNSVYLWYASNNEVVKLFDLGDDDTVCSVGWAHLNSHLAVGTSTGKLQIWDASQSQKIRTMEGHRQRVGAVAWSSSLLSSGSRDKSILQRDIRVEKHFVSRLRGHKSEVCGLKWSYDNCELASGGNDNRLFVWNRTSTQPVLKFREHTAPVKAIAWSPHKKGLVASGGGTADGCIRFWDTTRNSHLKCIETGSMVSNLVWSKSVNELVSTHGSSQNQIIVWRYPLMSKLATLSGHSTDKVLYLAISPDGQNIVTAAGDDERLMFWNVFPSLRSHVSQNTGFSSIARTQIR